MSYILDALRRAEAEREREKSAVPGLHAQPLAPAPADDPRRVTLPLRAAAAVLGGVALLGVTIYAIKDGLPSAPGSAHPSVVVVPNTAPRVPNVAAAPADDGAASAPVAPAVVEAAPMPAPAPVAVAATPAPLPEPAPAPARAVTPAPMPAPAPAPVAAASAPLPALPASERIAVGGSIWSDAPADRMLILNGQVLHEGEHVSPDVVLERIGRKSAVLNVRGTRYQVGY